MYHIEFLSAAEKGTHPMSRRKRVEAEQAVIRVARDISKLILPLSYNDWVRLWEAVNDLDSLEAGEITDALGPHVHGAPETSATAASLSGPLAGSMRREIIDRIRCQPSALRGMTEDELEVALKRGHSSVSSAVNHLATVINWLQDSGYRRPTRGGRDAIVWELTPAARELAGRS